MEKRKFSFLEIINMSLGFLGIQFGFALQNANASRILQIFGADVDHLSWFWIVAPLTGLIVQPIIGYYSDKTWTRLGRRRPFFLTGAILAAVGLVLMPKANLFIAILPPLWVGAGMLMIMDASFNVAMEPFRALVADNLSSRQRTVGFSVQTILIGIGAVIGSWLPYVLTNWFGLSNQGIVNDVPLNLIWSFVIGAVVLVTSILITVFTTKEYSPEALAGFENQEVEADKESSLFDIFSDFAKMPHTMRQLSWVQFFSWFGLFGMWVYTTPAIAQHIYKLSLNNVQSKTYSDAGDWVGVLFGVYNLIATFYAFLLPGISRKIGRTKTHAFSLALGAIGLLSIYIMPNKDFLILSMIGVGIAWASILAMPYAIVAGAIPYKKMGVYMGIFNFFIVLPQILNSIISGPLIKYLYNGKAIYVIILSGISLLIAAYLALRVNDVDDVKM
ncbi:MFS transporter [Zhouia sp. PK063]|uniref:MFS transporter n=1 Tax=Zhouia sp. PK063 TaxID=3373602 RepID=UPI0037A5275E